MSRQTYLYLSNIINFVSVILCVFVVGVSRILAKRKIHVEYQFIVAFNTTIDLAYAITCLVGAPCFVMTDNLFFLSMENHKFSSENDRLAACLAFTFCGFLQLLLLNIAIHFYYRYNVVRFSNYFPKSKFLRFYGAFSLWVILYFVTAQIEIRPAGNYIDVLYRIPGFETSPPLVYVFDLNYWSSILTTLDFQLTGTAFYIVGGFFGFKIVKELRRLKASAREAMDAQRYMVRVLIVQAIYPLLVLLVPSTIMVSLFFLHKTFVPFCFVMGLSVQSLPILNAISVLLLVPSYRKLITGSKVSSLNTTPSIKSPKSLLFFK